LLEEFFVKTQKLLSTNVCVSSISSVELSESELLEEELLELLLSFLLHDCRKNVEDATMIRGHL